MTAVGRVPDMRIWDPGHGFSHPLHAGMVAEIRNSLVLWVENERDAGRSPDMDDRRAFAETVCSTFFKRRAEAALVEGRPALSASEESELRQAAVRSAFGTPWERHLDPSFSDVTMNGPTTVFGTVRETGEKVALPPVANSEEEFNEQIRFVANHGGRVSRRFDEANPTLNLRLNNGARLHAVMSPITRQTSVSIRIHAPELSRLNDLLQAGMVDQAMFTFLRAAVRARKTFIVVGSTGAGKTTLSRALLNEVDPAERLITIEDDFELGLSQWPDLNPDLVEYESREANIEGRGAFTLEMCLKESLRQNPSRVVVGEVRGGEVFAFLLAISNGRPGSLCTIHANSTAEAFERLALYASMSPHEVSHDSLLRLIGAAVDLVVHVENLGGARVVSSIREVVGVGASGQVESLEIWGPDRDRGDGRGLPTGIFPTDRLRRDLARHGFDPATLRQVNGTWSGRTGVPSPSPASVRGQ